MNEPVRFRDAVRFWLKLGFISFGGPAGQIAVMHAELVERRRREAALRPGRDNPIAAQRHDNGPAELAHIVVHALRTRRAGKRECVRV